MPLAPCGKIPRVTPSEPPLSVRGCALVCLSSPLPGISTPSGLAARLTDGCRGRVGVGSSFSGACTGGNTGAGSKAGAAGLGAASAAAASGVACSCSSVKSTRGRTRDGLEGDADRAGLRDEDLGACLTGDKDRSKFSDQSRKMAWLLHWLAGWLRDDMVSIGPWPGVIVLDLNGLPLLLGVSGSTGVNDGAFSLSSPILRAAAARALAVGPGLETACRVGGENSLPRLITRGLSEWWWKRSISFAKSSMGRRSATAQEDFPTPGEDMKLASPSEVDGSTVLHGTGDRMAKIEPKLGTCPG